jgi:hypothetical protein
MSKIETFDQQVLVLHRKSDRFVPLTVRGVVEPGWRAERPRRPVQPQRVGRGRAVQRAVLDALHSVQPVTPVEGRL